MADQVLKEMDQTLAALARIMPGELSKEEHDRLEKKANAAVSTIRSLRNMSSPVHKIPSFLPDITQLNPVIKTVSRVCTKWREAALSFPSLWTTISQSEGPSALLAIQRSCDAPLRVYASAAVHPPSGWTSWNHGPPTPVLSPSPSQMSARLLDALIPHAHRIEELHIMGTDEDSVCDRALMTRPLPNLQSLTLSLNSSSIWTPFGQSWNPPQLFGGETPRLRQLTLRCAATFPSHVFVGLTHLCLSGQPERFTLSRVLDMLELSPQLEELDILATGPIADDMTHSKVMMPSLRRLCLSEWNAAISIASFLDFLIILQPIEFYLWFAVVDPPMGPPSLANIFPLYSSQGDGLKELRITMSSRDPYQPMAGRSWRSEHQYGLVSTSDTLQVDGKFQPSEFILEAPTMLTLGGVQTLWLGSAYRTEPTITEWRTFFSSLRSLVTLVISRRPSHAVISALTLPKDDPNGELLCPHLETLRIYGDRLLSVLRLSIFAEQRDRRDSRLKLVEVISDGKNRRDGQDDGYGGYTGIPYASPSPYPPAPILDANGDAIPPWPEAVVSDLLHLQEYVDKVEYMKVETDPDWDVVTQWPPRAFLWMNRSSSSWGY
ncbi:hypothetical protein BDN71DRAFT_186874 [Pleurotus eryngii]|uniref:F-box domain-containing protein n=1 Tax=Pleurotus eryngii TaxID=5323 RepID=A0A9P6DB99_PLEER|nr:hypothetical protein BDN71DRAFT_186874 [Pleurotus eryngii]